MKLALTFVLGVHLMLGTAFAAGVESHEETSPPSLEVPTSSPHQVSSASSQSPYSTSLGMPEDTSAAASASSSFHTAVETDHSTESHDEISETLKMILAGNPEEHKKWLKDVISILVKMSSESPMDAYMNATTIIESLDQNLQIANKVRKEYEAKLRDLQQERKD